MSYFRSATTILLHLGIATFNKCCVSEAQQGKNDISLKNFKLVLFC